MPDFKNSYGAGLRNGYVRNAAGNIFDIDAIIEMEAEASQDDTEIQGDDEVKARFSYNRKEEITISANGLSLDVIQAITGNTLSSSAGGAEIPVGTVSELNPPYVEVVGETNARTKDGAAAVVRKTYHKVQLSSVTVTTSNGSEMSVEMTGIAYQTTADITGVALSPGRTSTISVRSGSI